MENLRVEKESTQPESEKVVISLPEDNKRVGQLKDKLQEYIQRREKDQEIIDDVYKPPEEKKQAASDSWDAYYKGTVLGRLLSQKSVDSEALLNELKQSNGERFNQASFESAIKIIKDYAETGGKNLRGGTGLRDVAGKPEMAVPQKKSNIVEIEDIGHHLTEQEIEERKGIREWLKNPEEVKKSAEEARIANEEEEKVAREKKESAFNILSDPKVSERKFEEVKEIFKEATDKDLVVEREKLVEGILGARGSRVIKGPEATKEYRQQFMKKEKEKIASEDHSNALRIFWERNSNMKEADREKYLESVKAKLGLNPHGDSLVLDKLINDGYEVEKAKVKWFSGKFILPKIGVKAVLVCDSKADFLKHAIEEVNNQISEGARSRADQKIKEGRKRLWTERIICTQNAITQAINEHKLEAEKQKAEQAEAEKQKAKEEAEKKEAKKKKKAPIKKKPPVTSKKKSKK